MGFDRRDVRRASLLSVNQPGFKCRFCNHTQLCIAANVESSADSANALFPLLLGHDGLDIGGDGSEKADFALGVMPDAQADSLIDEERRALAELEDQSDTGAKFDIIGDFRSRCTDWLESSFDDARLLFCGLDAAAHRSLLPLLYALVLQLAPAGAMLEVRVQSDTDAQPTRAKPGLIFDRTHGVVYTLEPDYFSHDCVPAQALLAKFGVVRHRWNKDGGIPLVLYTWMRYRKGVPLDVVRMLHARLYNGTNPTCGPGMLPQDL